MKKWINKSALGLLAMFAALPNLTAQSVGEGMAILPVDKVKQSAPLFYSVEAQSQAALGDNQASTTMSLRFWVHQGRAKKLTVGLSGAGKVTSVTGVDGTNLASWSVRDESDGKRYLDIFPALPEAKPAPIIPQPQLPFHGISLWHPAEIEPIQIIDGPREFKVTVLCEHETKDREAFKLALPTRGDAIGFTSSVNLNEDAGFQAKILEINGLYRMEGDDLKFRGGRDPWMNLQVLPIGDDAIGIEVQDPQLVGRLSMDGKSMSFTLTGNVIVREEGASIELLNGVAINGGVDGANWHIGLKQKGDDWVHELVGDTPGTSYMSLKFDVSTYSKDDWEALNFALPAGVVVPVRLEGMPDEIEFNQGMPLVPEKINNTWVGYLNAEGAAMMAWEPTGLEDGGSLFFSSSEVAEVRMGAGLMRQSSLISLRVLQGEIETLRIEIDGDGEILSVDGDPVLGWKVGDDAGQRYIDVELSRPIEGEEQLRVVGQSALGAFPVESSPMRMMPKGTLRHSGYVRLGNEGAVRVEVLESKGLMQLAPAQFPGPQDERLRQSFVYRFPSGDYEFTVGADQVLPEVSLSEVTIHEMAETDRRIHTQLELDIREAPIREWSVGIPGDFAVAEVTGSSVSDYSLASDENDGVRVLKVLFNGAISGRQLVKIKLEKNQGASEDDWTLPRLLHPDAKSTRGYIGVASAPGYRVVPGTVSGLTEAPVDYFPVKMQRLQQGFRIKDEDWQATMTVEALDQNVQADVFHLYSLKEGVAYGSVLLNYFVVGAPSSEWRLKVPEGIGNIEVTGQSVGRDWSREGEELIIPLARPVIGSSTIAITFEQPMSARGGVLTPGEIRPLNVESERGYVQVTSPLQVNSNAKSEGSVLRIDASELPAEYRLLSSAPTIAAWQYTAGDLKIEIDIQWYDVGEAIGELIDFASLDSHISRDGQVVTTARLFVRAKGAATLEFNLPSDANLWEARVGGERVNARVDGDKTLVPLPRQLDLNEAVEVVMRYGQSFDDKRIRLDAPGIGTAAAITNWTVRGDSSRRLIPHEAQGGELVRPVVTENGFEWIAHYGRKTAPILLAVAALGIILSRIRSIRILGVALLITAAVISFIYAKHAIEFRRVNLAVLEYTAPAVLEAGDLYVVVDNLKPMSAKINFLGLIVAVIGALGLAWTAIRSSSAFASQIIKVVGGLMIALGVLAQPGGAIAFFILLGVGLLLIGVLPRCITWIKDRNTAVPTAAATLLLFGFAGLDYAKADHPAELISEEWTIVEEQLEAKMDIRVRAEEAGQRFNLLDSPAILKNFNSSDLKVIKEGGKYLVVANRAGALEGEATYQLKVPNPRNGWNVPTGAAAVHTVQASYDKAGWQFVAERAASITDLRTSNLTRKVSVIHFKAGDPGSVYVRPQQRDATQEKVRFFTEVADLYLPGPGVVNGMHRIAVRPAQGVVRELSIEIPEGFTVGDVGSGPVGRWKFNPETRDLRVSIEPAQERAFSFEVATQKAAGSLPVDLTLKPMRIGGSAGSVGMLGLGFGGETQPEAVKPEGMGPVNLDDFPSSLIPKNNQNEPLALLQHAYRYGVDDASVSLKVTSVAPEIRADLKQTLSLGDDRMVLAADLTASITRAGVFRLSMEIPSGLEVESVTGPALSHWNENESDGVRLLILNLNGRTMGDQTFAISLAGPAPGSVDSWEVPRMVLRDATRQRGTLTVVPDRGLQVRSVDRIHVSQLDPRELGVPRPGALAFRLLQSDWSLSLDIQELEPWVTAQALHQVTLREGQIRTQVRLVYRIENAARKTLKVTLPALDNQASGTVRATGPAVADFEQVSGEDGEPGVWEIRFQRGVVGTTTVDIEFQEQSDAMEAEVVPLELQEVRQSAYFVALEAGGRLDASVESVARGWQKLDWNGVTPELREMRGSDIPDFTFRVAEAEAPLKIKLARHDLAGAETLRVSSGHLTTLISMDGSSMTEVRLKLDANEKESLRLILPGNAQPFNLLVNGEGVPLVRNGDQWLFYVNPSPLGNGPAEVSFSYSIKSDDVGALTAPQLDVPLENLVWDVFVPEGWDIEGSRGDFQWVSSQDVEEMDLNDYRQYVNLRREQGRQEATAELEQGFEWLKEGRQDKASKVLGKAARNGYLDEASNEDARVQFRNLKMQQAVLGLNTRRQRNYLDNKFNQTDAPNQQIEQAANENPILQQGSYNFDPTQFDRLLMGNTAEETSSLKDIASCIVAQQLELEGAPDALDIDLLGQGRMIRFERSLQVKGDQAMTLDLKLRREQQSGWLYGSLIALLSVVVLLVALRTKDVVA